MSTDILIQMSDELRTITGEGGYEYSTQPGHGHRHYIFSDGYVAVNFPEAVQHMTDMLESARAEAQQG
jgi:hypothetical protein